MATKDYDSNDILIIRILESGEIKVVKAFMLDTFGQDSYVVESNLNTCCSVGRFSGIAFKAVADISVRNSAKKEAETSDKEVYDHFGTQYDSIKSMCDAYGISQQVFYRKRRQGRPLEECLTRGRSGRRPGMQPKTTGRRGRPKKEVPEKLPSSAFEFAGKTYRSRREFCQINEVNYQKFNSLLNEGNTIEEAMRTIAERSLRKIPKESKKTEPAPVIVRRIRKEDRDSL